MAPFASPETLRHLPSMLLQRDGPVRVRPGADPAFLRWGLAFLRACRGRTVQETVAAQLLLAQLSKAELGALTARLPLEFGWRVAGKLVAYRDPAGLAVARRAAEAGLGIEQRVLTGAECLALEPGLRIPAGSLAGGVYTPSEEVGDCGAFCDGLGAALKARNDVRWYLGAEARPVIEGGRLAAVLAGGERVEADAFVLAFGSGAPRFAAGVGLRLPIYPMKGYSLTARPRTPIEHSVTDADRKVVFAPLDRGGERLIRIAGVADMVGHDGAPDPQRLAAVRRAAAEALDLLPGDDQPWSGLRPATPDSRPIIGWSRVPGLFLNTGHGALGWTLACGSARLAASMLTGVDPALSPAPFAPRALRPALTPSWRATPPPAPAPRPAAPAVPATRPGPRRQCRWPRPAADRPASPRPAAVAVRSMRRYSANGTAEPSTPRPATASQIGAGCSNACAGPNAVASTSAGAIETSCCPSATAAEACGRAQRANTVLQE